MSSALSLDARAPFLDVRAPTRRRLRVPLLLGVFVVLSFGLDVRGTLGTDTGGKLATLEEMDRHSTLVPDVGYWAAQFDPDAAAHPLYYTQRFADGYVNVTTLPMLLAARPLDAVGGTRLVLLLPILGGVLAAVGARRLAVRFGSIRPDVVFWIVGLASPTLIYSLDVWEHSLGLGLMALGVDSAFALLDGRSIRHGFGVGLAFGAAATMRTEALLYLAIVGAIVAIALWGRSRRAVPVALASIGFGAAAPLGLNELVERALLGDPLRSARASDTLASGGLRIADRFDEGLRTTVGLNLTQHDVASGALLVVALVVGGAAMVRSRRTVARFALASATLLLGLRMTIGFGFVSGMVTALPVAAFAAVAPSRRLRTVAACSLAALPAVWSLQYLGGAGPQWGGRYVLLPGLLLGVVGLIAIERAEPSLRRWGIGLSVAVTLFGFLGLVERTHAVADAGQRLAAFDDGVVISTEAHLFREVGSEYRRDRRWLTAVGPEASAIVGDLLRELRPASFAVITRGATIDVPRGYVRWDESIDFLGVDFVVRHYVRGVA